MKKILLAFGMMLCMGFLLAQTVTSPEKFLGYTLGSHFTPHYKIVEYCKAVAAAKPDMVKLEQYGTTNEGRQLLTLIVTSPENMKRIEDIRVNNLRLAGMQKDNTAGNINNAPAIVWLSYNVHGNEPSSSEAAMLTLYALVDPSNASTKEWLKHTVVIIDPCLNPDGRDRYVNWFNQTAGITPNADPQSREHNEPWPGGRSNHYNFDLNRDWAWQTQIESKQRVRQYNQWLPEVHVDFHEQGYNDPYYFAPAAEPFHEVITPWQRSFQTEIGKNNAKYFDDNGWLYFTKERFDLFYPSYGDTYPLYNGSIGMTYEQAGHSAGGLAVINSAGDTLTLTDRVNHHYTTGLSTIEITSKNAQRVVTEFKSFFDDAKAAKASEYKTYILTSDDETKLDAIKNLLQQNGIEYGTTQSAAKGWSYTTGKEEDVKALRYSIAVSAYQPKSILVKVLFEPKSKLVDSATYDITAWSIPYAYGVEGYALKEKKEVSVIAANILPVASYTTTYGYIFPYTSFSSARFMVALLKKQVKIRMAQKPFTYKGKLYASGTLILLKPSQGYDAWNEIINTAAHQYHVQPEVVTTGFMDKGTDFGSPDIRMIIAPKVALLTGDGVSSTAAGEVWNLFDQQLEYPITLLNAANLNRYSLKNYNVLIIPDGYYRTLNDKDANDKLKEFVRSGGKVIALENAVSQLASNDWGFKQKEEKDEKGDDKKEDYSLLKKYADRDRDYLPNSTPGAIYKIELDNTHPLAFGYPAYYYTLKQDVNIYEFMKDGWNVGVFKKENYVSGFAGYKAKMKLKDGWLLGVQEIGNGNLVLLADNPIFRLFWENGKLLFSNAVFVVGQ